VRSTALPSTKKGAEGRDTDGPMRLSKLTREQAARISELTGASGRGAGIGVDLSLFAQIVVNTGRFDSLESLVQMACGEPLPNLRAARDERSARWQQVWAAVSNLNRNRQEGFSRRKPLREF
jgi:hypothetical protein